MNQELVFGVSDFVAVFNQTITYAYPEVTIVGELANFRVSKNRWVYFDLKDEFSSVKFFGSVYNLPGPLEEGMVLKVTGAPQLHNLYGFSITVRSILLEGAGTIKKAAQLLAAKLEKEGLFDPDRKRTLPYPPETIGLITSGESAAYADFTKIIQARWGGVVIKHFDVQVQGEDAPAQIVKAVEYFNSHSAPVDVLVVTRGGGSADDLQAFSTEAVTRAVAASRIPTLVAIGHEIDLSLSELAADMRASTPSNAAELLVPDKKAEKLTLSELSLRCQDALAQNLKDIRASIEETKGALVSNIESIVAVQKNYVQTQRSILGLANPDNILQRGYAIVQKNGKTLRSIKQVATGEDITVRLSDGELTAEVKKGV